MNARFFSLIIAGVLFLAASSVKADDRNSVGFDYQRGITDLTSAQAEGEGGGIIATVGKVSFGGGAQFYDHGIWSAIIEGGIMPHFKGGFFVGANLTGVFYHDPHPKPGVAKNRLRPGIFLPIGHTSLFDGKKRALDFQVGVSVTPGRDEGKWYPSTAFQVRLSHRWLLGEPSEKTEKPSEDSTPPPSRRRARVR